VQEHTLSRDTRLQFRPKIAGGFPFPEGSPFRGVFILSRYHSLKYAQIARMLGISVKADEARLSRALRDLQRMLKVSHEKHRLSLFSITPGALRKVLDHIRVPPGPCDNGGFTSATGIAPKDHS
jgi:hypothetical protein